MGIISLIYLLNNHHTAEEMTVEIDATIVYKLVKNTTYTNQYSDDNMTVLRYAAEVKIKDDTYVPISVMDWSKQLISSDQELIAFSSILANSPMKAFFFETQGIDSKSSYVEQFEFVLVESSYLYTFADDKQDELTFSEHFEQCKEANEEIGCVFYNPSRSSVIITPLNLQPESNNVYGHLASFIRRAPSSQITSFLRMVVQRYVEEIEMKNEDKVWLSTDGTGVAWLHFRLDPIPKYYDYRPFADGE